jgi:hypothetical protein
LASSGSGPEDTARGGGIGGSLCTWLVLDRTKGLCVSGLLFVGGVDWDIWVSIGLSFPH